MVCLSTLAVLLAPVAHSLIIPQPLSNATTDEIILPFHQRGFKDLLSSIADKIDPHSPVCHFTPEAKWNLPVTHCQYACGEGCDGLSAHQGQEILLNALLEKGHDCKAKNLAENAPPGAPEVVGVECQKGRLEKCREAKVKCSRKGWPWQWDW